MAGREEIEAAKPAEKRETKFTPSQAADLIFQGDAHFADGLAEEGGHFLHAAAYMLRHTKISPETALWSILPELATAEAEAVLVGALPSKDAVASPDNAKRQIKRKGAPLDPAWEASRLADLKSLHAAASSPVMVRGAATAILRRVIEMIERSRVGEAQLFSQTWNRAHAALTPEVLKDLAEMATEALTRAQDRAAQVEDSVFTDLVEAPPAGQSEPEGFDAPILICGFSHSGTRLAALALAQAGVFQHMPSTAGEWGYVKSINTVLAPDWMDLSGQGEPSPTRPGQVIDRARLLRRLTEQGYAGGPWGWKDPRGMVTAGDWLTVFPKARILHIVRDPRDSLGTLTRHYRRYSLADLPPQQEAAPWAALWLRHIESIRAAMPRAAAACEIRFEELCREPEATLNRALDALKLTKVAKPLDLAGLEINAKKTHAHRSWVASGELSPEALAVHAAAAAKAGL